MSGEPLRLKDLFAVNLEVDRDTQDTLDKKYVTQSWQHRTTEPPNHRTNEPTN